MCVCMCVHNEDGMSAVLRLSLLMSDNTTAIRLVIYIYVHIFTVVYLITCLSLQLTWVFHDDEAQINKKLPKELLLRYNDLLSWS